MIAVTGANGLLGSFIVRELISRNQAFVALKRNGSDTSLLSDVSHKIIWRNGDVLNTQELGEALEGVTMVIHAAAVVSFNPRRASFVLDVNVQGTRNVVNECQARNVKRLVHISSVAALGRQKDQTYIDETNQWVDSPLQSVYDESKYLAELEVFRAQEEGLDTVILNPSLILAPADWTKSSAQLFRYVWHERPFFTDAYLNYVDVRDVASITCRLLDETTLSGERFVVNAGKISFHDFFRAVARRFRKKPPHLRLGYRLLDLAGRAEVLRTWFTGTEPILTRETARLAGTDFLYNNQKIKKALSVEFQPIDVTLDWCCEYYLKKYVNKN
jgi:dihydroflavonol-4-reductase